jgi:mannobiose 2-epimerase
VTIFCNRTTPAEGSLSGAGVQAAIRGLFACCFLASVPLLCVVPACGQPQPPIPAAKSADETAYLPAGRPAYLHFASETEDMLHKDVLDVWFPRSIDKVHGGFYSNFNRDWQRTRSEGKFSVFQGRMTWIAAQAAIRRPALRQQYLPYVRHGVDYLANVLWDKQYGGFYWGLDDEGKISPAYTDHKHLYGISFCIYGLAAAYKADHDPKVLALAQEAFRWTEVHAHDDNNQGYFEWLNRDGTPMQAQPYDPLIRTTTLADFPIGYKSMNTHIHLLEAYTQLYEVWKDETLRKRLEELLQVVRDKVTVEPGVMNLYFTNDWRALPDHDSYGHDIEAAYLMLEASEALGHPKDERTQRVSKMMVDHSLAYGWDETKGGIFHSGPFAGKPDDLLKEWWVEMESLNSLLLMHETYGVHTDVYWKAFQKQLQFIQKYQIDPELHGDYELIRPDGTPTGTDKGRIWKAAYHDGRALLNVSERLQRMAAVKAPSTP